MITEASSPNNFSQNYFDYLKVLIDKLSTENVSKFIELILETRENKYIIEAKRQIDSRLNKINSDEVSKFLSFPMDERIINSYNKMENS